MLACVVSVETCHRDHVCATQEVSELRFGLYYKINCVSHESVSCVLSILASCHIHNTSECICRVQRHTLVTSVMDIILASYMHQVIQMQRGCDTQVTVATKRCVPIPYPYTHVTSMAEHSTHVNLCHVKCQITQVTQVSLANGALEACDLTSRQVENYIQVNCMYLVA